MALVMPSATRAGRQRVEIQPVVLNLGSDATVGMTSDGIKIATTG
jgi:hypothetical protein